ncbi:MAG: TolC family protein [Flavobacteriales bacterium]|nr:TolC family protein [Flavobacteriales bacterium]
MCLALILGQGSLSGQADSGQVLTREMLMKLVLENHPAVRQAALRTAMGQATVRSARGAFDPQLAAGYEAKRFNGSSYYDLLDAGLKVPTWFGAEFYGGLQDHGGSYADPQGITPEGGYLKAGVQVPIGQGLFIDKRRADLRKAQAFQDMAEAERQLLLNEVLFEVLDDHVQWVAAYRKLLVSREAVRQAQVRFNAVKASFEGGDRPAIDTLEALLQVQDRTLRLQHAELEFQNAGVQLSNHLWDPQMRPLEISPDLRPEVLDMQGPIDQPDVPALLADALANHPKLQEQRGKLQQLDVDRRLRAEFLKPQLDLRYTLLSNGGVRSGEADQITFNSGDHLMGFAFQLPVPLRKERGELGLAKLRQTDADMALDRAGQFIRTAVNARANELAQTRQQVDLGRAMVGNYQGLLNGENRLFQAGESSLFLVNQREVALLDSWLRQVELEAKLRLAYFKLEKDAGALWRTFVAPLQP